MKRLIFASLLAAINVYLTLAYGKNDAKNGIQSTTENCPAPDEVTALHLYGTWQASWSDLNGGATLTFGRNPNHPDGVGGIIRRDAGLNPPEALVAGDVDNGAFTLEESIDGRAISATWSGSFADQACGKEIRGTWTDTATRIERAFVLRKQPGWQ